MFPAQAFPKKQGFVPDDDLDLIKTLTSDFDSSLSLPKRSQSAFSFEENKHPGNNGSVDSGNRSSRNSMFECFESMVTLGEKGNENPVPDSSTKLFTSNQTSNSSKATSEKVITAVYPLCLTFQLVLV